MTTPRDDLRERLEAEAIALSVRRFTDLDDTDADALAALLRKAAARLGEREWRDIAEAPKDGTWILAYDARAHAYGVIAWIKTSSRWSLGAMAYMPNLTHFKHLPPPPETTNDR